MIRRWLAGSMAALLLLGGGQGAGHVPRGGELQITLTDCSQVSIRETDTVRPVFSGEEERYEISMEPGQIAIRQRAAEEWEESVLELPRGGYATVRVEAGDSGLSVRPEESGYVIRAEESACNISLSPSYTGAVEAELTDCAGSLRLLGSAPEDLALTVEHRDSAVEVPDSWTAPRGTSVRRMWGAGSGSVAVRLDGCAFSIQEDPAGISRYDGQSGTAAMVRTELGEGLLGEPGWGVSTRTWDRDIETYRAEARFNDVTPIGSVPADGVTGLRINANFCGVAVEPSESGRFELSYVGADDPAAIPVRTEVRAGVLTVTAEGAANRLCYVSVAAGRRANTVRVGVPAGRLERLEIDCGTAIVWCTGLDVSVEAVATNGMVRVEGESLTRPVSMHCANGALNVCGGTVAGAVRLGSGNGSVGVKAERITGDTVLTAKNGTACLTAERVDNASVRAENGTVSAAVGEVGAHVYAGVSNGTLRFALTGAPRDLTFRLLDGPDRGWGWDWDEKSAFCRGWGGGLPRGWYDGCTVGNGGPLLELECASNGDLYFTAPDWTAS